MDHTKRYIGLDIHKRQVVAAGVDQQQNELLKPVKIKIKNFPTWAQENLSVNDSVALEATINSWKIHDDLQDIVAEVLVANSYKIKLISSSATKTDRHDALVLAKLLAANLLPTVWVPPERVRELRELTRYRSKLVGERNKLKSQLHNILHKKNLALPVGGPFTEKNELWWGDLPLNEVEKMQIGHHWQSIHQFDKQVSETEALIVQQSASDYWSEMMTFIMQIPGIGVYTGMTILAAIGDIERFPTPSQLVGYAGVGARVRASGDWLQTGKISKQGRRELRTALVNSAWVAVRFSNHWRHQFEKPAVRIGKKKAITAIARKLLVVIWHVLTKKEADKQADVQAVARSFFRWASEHGLARSQGIHRHEFVRARLKILGLLEEVKPFQANGRLHDLAIG
jgi:transposase